MRQQYMKVFLLLLGRFVVGIVLVMLIIYIVIELEVRSFILKNVQDLPHVHTAIVLGAGLQSNGEPGTILQDRMDTAIFLYQKNIVDVILVSGDDGSATHNEVNPSREYLLSKNIPSDAIFLDHAGFDTYSSMYRARDIFLVNKAIIVTQSFHLPRAVFIARNLGIQAYGVPSDQHKYSLKNIFREFFADSKAIIDIITHRKPKYLGDEIPITGESDKSI